jgi:hypothetical protein
MKGESLDYDTHMIHIASFSNLGVDTAAILKALFIKWPLSSFDGGFV